MSKILISIKPEFVDKIFSGQKQFEFRKVRCAADVNEIIIYSTNPVKMVVGRADVVDIITDVPDIVWDKTHDHAGISRDFFDSYFAGRNTATAYKLANVRKYAIPKPLSEFGITVAPQSFVYLHD